MMKINRLFLFVAFIMLVGNVAAQAPKKRQDLSPEQRIELRAEQMRQRLMLDEKAAARFVPLYKEYLQALGDCKPEAKKAKPVTDAEIKKALDDRLKMQRAVIDTKEEYLEKFSKFLTARQLEVVFEMPYKRPGQGHRVGLPCEKFGRHPHCGNPGNAF